MSTLLGNAYVRIRPDMDGFQNEANRGISTALKSAAKIAAVAATAALGTMGLKVLKDSVAEASNLNESLNAVQVTFGKNAKGITALGENAAKALGLSKTEFNDLAVRFSNFTRTIAGKGGDVVGTMKDLTTRASDFASVMNLDVNQAAQLFQSGLAGESEPLRQFGIDLSDAAVKAHALARGIWDGKGEMTEAEKVQARYSLLMKATNKTAGDFANTSDSLANRQRIANAQWKNAKASIGQALLPVMQSVTAFIQEKVVPAVQAFGDWFVRDGMPALTRFGGTLRDTVLPPLQAVVGWLIQNKDVLLPIAGVIGGMIAAWKTYAFVANMVKAAQLLLNLALSANPIGIVVMAIGALVAGLVLLFQKNETFRNIVLGAWEKIKAVAEVVWPAIQKVIEVVWGAIKWWVEHYVKAVWAVISTVWDWIKTGVDVVWPAIQKVIEVVWAAIKLYVTTYVNAVKAVIDFVWGAIKTGTHLAWQAIKTFIVDPIRTAWNVIQDVVGNVRSWLSDTWTRIKDRATAAWNNVKDAITEPLKNLWATFKSILGIGDNGITDDGPLGRLVNIFGKVKDAIGEKFKDVVKVIARPMVAAFRWVNENIISQLNDKVLAKFSSSFRIPHIPIPDIEGLATGGWVRGRGTGTSDSNLRALSKGEFVVNARSAAANAATLEAINKGRPPAQPSGQTARIAATGSTNVASWNPISWATDLFKMGAGKAVRAFGDAALGIMEPRFGGTFGGELAIGATRSFIAGFADWAKEHLPQITPLMADIAAHFEGMAARNAYVGVSTCLKNIRLALEKFSGKYGYGVPAGSAAWMGTAKAAANSLAGIAKTGTPPRGSISMWNYAPSGHVAANDGKGNFINNFGGATVETNPLDAFKNGWVGWVPPLAFVGQGFKYDAGGFLRPGWNAAYNGTGKPEAILTSEQWDALAGRGSQFHFEIHEAQPTTEDAILAAWRRADALYGVI